MAFDRHERVMATLVPGRGAGVLEVASGSGFLTIARRSFYESTQ